jgi:hypothetical protein
MAIKKKIIESGRFCQIIKKFCDGQEKRSKKQKTPPFCKWPPWQK